MVRNVYGLVFTLTLVAVFLIITGLMGWEPPAQLALDAATLRRGTWSDQVLSGRVGLGIAFLVAAGLVTFRINRRLAQAPKPSN